MKQLRILFFQPDYSGYREAYYQHQFPMALLKVHQVFMYGPGYQNYDSQHTASNVLTLCPFEPDLICFGAGWERSEHPTYFQLHPAINVADVGIPSVMILNKEYKKLDQKFQFILNNNIQIVFTAHHNYARWQEQLGVRFVHFPFAIDQKIFKNYGEPKRYDFGFSGMLLTRWIDLRLRIKHKLFWGGRIRRLRYRNLQMYWTELDNNQKREKNYYRLLNSRRMWLSTTNDADRKWGEEYSRLINSSRIWLSTTSAADLVGTRFFEVMASKSLLFCNRSLVYDGLFKDGKHCVMFDPNLSDFDDKLFYYLKNQEESQSIIEQAYRHVHENHTWIKRVEQFTKVVERFL